MTWKRNQPTLQRKPKVSRPLKLKERINLIQSRYDKQISEETKVQKKKKIWGIIWMHVKVTTIKYLEQSATTFAYLSVAEPSLLE